MISFKNMPTQSISYITEIITIQNRLKSQLPQLPSYSPDKHFQHLASPSAPITNPTVSPYKQKPAFAGTKTLVTESTGLYANSLGINDSIKESTLLGIIPKIVSQSEIDCRKYVGLVIGGLNLGWYARGELGAGQLLYRGYIRLITTQRSSYSGGSQVTKTLMQRTTYINQLQRNFKTKYQNNYNINNNSIEMEQRKADSLLGMILLLECIKVREIFQADVNINASGNVGSAYFGVRGNEWGKAEKFGKYWREDLPYHKIFTNSNTANTIYDNRSRQRRRTKIFQPRNSSLFGSPYRPKSPQNYNKSYNNLKNSFYQIKPNPEYTPGKSPYLSPNKYRTSAYNYSDTLAQTPSLGRLSYLEKFSDQSNVWRNLSQRNLAMRAMQMKMIGLDESSAFLGIGTPPREYSMNGDMGKSRLINTTDRSPYYYLKQSPTRTYH